VTLEPGPYRVEWFAVDGRDTAPADPVTVDGPGLVGFTAPFATGPAVLYLAKRA
jgi:hypothetical protein